MKKYWVIISSFLATATAVVILWLTCLPGNPFEGTPYSTVVYSSDGQLLGARVASDGQWRFPPCDSLPEKFAVALLAFEDRAFFAHPGINPAGTARAMIQNIRNGRVVSGGSTISMQTIRLYRRGKRCLLEKCAEMVMATRLESMHSKYDILKMYASHAPFGENVVGIDAAVWRYLGHPGNEMSWAEAATLAVMQNAPSSINLTRNRDRLLDKRNRLLRRLRDDGVLDSEEYELAVDEPLIEKPKRMPAMAPHIVEYYHRTRKGQRTVTSIDYTIQRRLESLLATRRAELATTGADDMAAVVVDVATGQVIAYCGNADMSVDRPGVWVDIARAPRSSGSILKPLLYCAALQDGMILPHTLLPDVPTDFGGFAPKNFDGDNAGVVTADEALALSLNVPYVHLLKQYGVSRFAALLHDLGLTTINPATRNYGLSLILGGAEVTLVDVVKCYAAIARGDGSMKLNDPVAVYAMLDAMRSVNRPDQLDYTRVSSVQNIAWKTGTSYGARDGWAIGITPGYAVGVWVGNADGRGVAALTGARTAGPVMFDIFNLLPRSGWFDAPVGSAQRICSKSGHLAGKYCEETVMQTVPENAPRSQRCPYCRQLPVSLDGLRRVADGAEPATMKSFFILPPVTRYFYKKHHADYIDPPAATVSSSDDMKFIYPADGAVISLPGTDDAKGSIICRAAHSNPSAQLFWHLDNGFVVATADIHEIKISPSRGFHRLTIVDETGLTRSLTFTVR